MTPSCPHIAGDRIDTVSTQGYALGYLGGGILLAVNLAMIMKPELFGIANAEWGSRISFLTVGIWWAVFTLPVMLNVPEPPVTIVKGEYRNPVAAGFQRLAKTFAEVRNFKETFKMLIAFWLYNDGIGTIIVMATVFGSEIGIAQTDLIGAILAVQFLGIPFTLLFGRIAGRFSPKTGILISLGHLHRDRHRRILHPERAPLLDHGRHRIDGTGRLPGPLPLSLRLDGSQE